MSSSRTVSKQTMRACWYERQGPARDVLVVGERPMPMPGPGEVRVRLATSGPNPSDTKRRAGFQGIPMPFPRVIPHSDGAGVIDAVGDGVSEQRVGERVWVYFGGWKRADGTAAEAIALPSAQAVPLPTRASFAMGATLGIPALTAHHAVLGDGPVRDRTVLVTGGAGSVGFAAVALARWAGAQVITTVSSREKAEVAQRAGAHHVIDYRSDDVVAAVRGIAGSGGVDRVIDVAFGNNLPITSQIIAEGGTIATYGSEVDPRPHLDFYPLMQRNLTLRLCFVYLMRASELDEAKQGLAAAIDDAALPEHVATVLPLDAAATAHEAIEKSSHIGNIVLNTSEDGRA